MHTHTEERKSRLGRELSGSSACLLCEHENLGLDPWNPCKSCMPMQLQDLVCEAGGAMERDKQTLELTHPPAQLKCCSVLGKRLCLKRGRERGRAGHPPSPRDSECTCRGAAPANTCTHTEHPVFIEHILRARHCPESHVHSVIVSHFRCSLGDRKLSIYLP